MTSRLHNVIFRLAGYGGLGALISLMGYLGRYHYLLDQLGSFRVQYVIACGVALVLALLSKRRFLSVLLLVIMGIHGIEVGRLYLPAGAHDRGQPGSLRVMSSNLLASSVDYTAHIQYIKDTEPDLIIFQEYTPDWHQALSANLPEYTHRVSETIDSPFGIALYSKLAFDKVAVSYIPGSQAPAIDGTLAFGEKTLRFIGVHPPPPISSALFDERNRYLQWLAIEARAEEGDVLVVGDLNVTPWSIHFRSLIENGELHNARQGFGVLPTWPSALLPMRIPIDHFLAGKSLIVNTVQISKHLGSDHRSIWVELSIRE